MKTTYLLAASAAAVLASAPAAAETLKKVPAKLDPAKAYVLVEYKLQKNPLGNFPGSRKYMPLSSGLVFARYDPALGDVRGLGKAKANPVPAKQRPTEPFRNRELAKGDAARLFLIELDPDTWVILGFGNTSFSLGSYAFALEPGTITDLGVAEPEPDWAEGDRAANIGDVMGAALLGPFAKRPAIAPMRVSFRERTAADMAIPAGLPVDRVQPVKFTTDVKFGNYLGGLVNRIEGVNARLKAENAPTAAGTSK
jgi:hypothetical protein